MYACLGCTPSRNVAAHPHTTTSMHAPLHVHLRRQLARLPGLRLLLLFLKVGDARRHGFACLLASWLAGLLLLRCLLCLLRPPVISGLMMNGVGSVKSIGSTSQHASTEGRGGDPASHRWHRIQNKTRDGCIRLQANDAQGDDGGGLPSSALLEISSASATTRPLWRERRRPIEELRRRLPGLWGASTFCPACCAFRHTTYTLHHHNFYLRSTGTPWQRWRRTTRWTRARPRRRRRRAARSRPRPRSKVRRFDFV